MPKLTPNLMRETHDLMIADERTIYQLAVDSQLPFYWLRKFRAGEMKNPSVNRVQCLYEYLTKKALITR